MPHLTQAYQSVLKDGTLLRTVEATRYVTSLREGGSVPAIVEAEDGELYVLKFVGAGQGRKALIAELVAGEIGRALGLPVPEIVFVELDPVLGRSEPHPEIQSVLLASAGLNLGLRYLSHATAFDPLLAPPPGARLASEIVWFDAYVTNVDRTPRNVNMLIWRKDLWLIDHGSSLYFHHSWNGYMDRSRKPFSLIKEHVLLPLAGQIREVDSVFSNVLSPRQIHDIVDLIPREWLENEPAFDDVRAHRKAYADYLVSRLEASSVFVEEAVLARQKSV